VTTRVGTTTGDALGEDDLCGLLERLRRREVSAAELRAAALARSRTADSCLNAVTVWVEEPVRTEVVVPADAPFGGVPTLVKDNEDLTGYPTSQGSAAVRGHPARTCSPVVAQLLRLGLSPIGKTTLPEFGLTASTESTRFGATRNPWDTTRSAGGSSGGAAAMVAAGVVPLAHANDGGGSIRIPAACCGLVGLKPSRGRIVDRPELQQLPVPLVAQGVVTRTVRDTARYLAEAERLMRPPDLPPVGVVDGPAAARLRVAVTSRTVRGLPVSPTTQAAVRNAAELCQRLGHHVDEVGSLTDDMFGRDFLHYWALLAFLLQHGGARLYGRGFDPDRTEPLTKALSQMAAAAALRLPASLRRLRRLARQGEGLFERYDVLLTPVTGSEAPPLGHLGPDVDPHDHLVRLLQFTSFTPLQNVTGSPALSLPLGRTPTGLPIGVHLAAARGQERRLLELAFELDAAAPWPRHPL
jgi:amidase